jgi:integrase/recombinase XerD
MKKLLGGLEKMKFFDIFKKSTKDNHYDNLAHETLNDKDFQNIMSFPPEKVEDSKSKDILLKEYKEYLLGYKKWSDNTKRTYYNSLKKALKNQEFNSPDEIDINKLGDYLIENTKRKNDVSKVKNSLKLFLEINNVTTYDKTRILENIRSNKPKGYKRKMEILKLKNTIQTLSAIKNKKLKLGYRLMINSGLRISEISNLRKNDIEFCGENRLKVQVLNGKGGKNRKFKTFWQDEYLYNELKDHVKNLDENGKLFYSASHMQNCANKLGFETHDFRRAFAQIIYYHYNGDKEQTIKLLQKLLGHNINSKTYLTYLNRDINFNGTKYDI